MNMGIIKGRSNRQLDVALSKAEARLEELETRLVALEKAPERPRGKPKKEATNGADV